MSSGEDNLEINVNQQHDDYGDPIPPQSNSHVYPVEFEAGYYDPVGGYEADEDPDEDMNWNGHFNGFSADDLGDGWSFLPQVESVDGQEGAENRPVGLPALSNEVYISAYNRADLEVNLVSIGPPHPFCNCACHKVSESEGAPDEWMPDVATPSPEGMASLSSLVVEVSSGEHSVESSGYFSPPLSFGELARLMGAQHPQILPSFEPAQRYFFINRPLPVNGHNVMPVGPMRYFYPMGLSSSSDDLSDDDED